ncbi:hypothetical protein [Streptomyces sp. NPDC057696]|uniref:hypothetical protein n=1 Tax=Streptomyces sp. NPDC057696 TaxID=3346218 RepID=UPI003675AEEF
MTQVATAMRPWWLVVRFGTVSLLADFVHEGARSVTGPLLASLGASATVVGAVTGADEAALLLRLVPTAAVPAGGCTTGSGHEC